VFAVLLIADFPLQALLRARPDLARKPVALLADSRREAPITACNARARSASVEPGLTGPQALARCPGLTLCVPDPTAEAEAHAAQLAIAFSLTPAVEATAPGHLTLDLSSHSSRKPNITTTAEPLLRHALTELASHDLTATAGLARTPLLARYAAELADPFLAVENNRAFLDPLPLVTADPPAALVPILHAWGVRTLGDLTALPKKEIAQRLGAEGTALWERAAGETTRPLRLVTPTQHFRAYYDSEHELETLEPVLFLLRRFVDRLSRDLSNAALAASTLILTLVCTDASKLTRSFRLPEPSTHADIFFRTLHTWLETLQLRRPIKSVLLEIEPIRAPIRQHGLFENALVDAHGFAETLARAVAIVGSDRVGTPRLENTHRPDAFTLTAPTSVLAPTEVIIPFSLRGLPLRRFRPPITANVELQSTYPAYLWTPQLHAAITAAQGPYRTSGDWWETAHTWSREEWDIELADGGLYRLAHNLLTQTWLLEGEYD
jgi:protein ImuB